MPHKDLGRRGLGVNGRLLLEILVIFEVNVGVETCSKRLELALGVNLSVICIMGRNLKPATSTDSFIGAYLVTQIHWVELINTQDLRIGIG